jgi:hypothetical protein
MTEVDTTESNSIFPGLEREELTDRIEDRGVVEQ